MGISLKICLIGEYTYKQWCGSATRKFQKYLLRELSLKNEVFLFELPYPSTRLAKLISPVKIKFIPEGKIISGGIIPFIFFLLVSARPEIIHLTVIRRFMLGLLPLWLIPGKTKIFLTIHDSIILQEGNRTAEYYLKILLIKRCNLVLVYSQIDFDTICRYKNPDCIKIMKNGVDLSLYRAPERVQDSTIITFAGGLGNKIKGLIFLETALRQCCQNFSLIICGENQSGHYHNSYKGSLDEVRFIQLLQKSFLVIVPSEYESFSLTALEAMAAGVPVILTHSTGVSFYLKHRFNCLKVNYGDVAGLVNAIKLLWQNRALYISIRSEALNSVKEFDWTRVVAEYQEVYQHVYEN